MDGFLACKVRKQKSWRLEVSGVSLFLRPSFCIVSPGLEDLSVNCSPAVEFVHKNSEKHPRGTIYYLWKESSNGVTKAQNVVGGWVSIQIINPFQL